MKYNGINFNEIYWRDKSEEYFISQEAHHGLTLKQMKEVFALMNPYKKSEKVQKIAVEKSATDVSEPIEVVAEKPSKSSKSDKADKVVSS